MQISARIENAKGEHRVSLETDGREQSLTVLPKPDGFGSSVNGGELLFLAIATCYCNDIYREAAKRGIEVQKVEVKVDGEFGRAGAAAEHITYRAAVTAKARRREGSQRGYSRTDAPHRLAGRDTEHVEAVVASSAVEHRST